MLATAERVLAVQQEIGEVSPGLLVVVVVAVAAIELACAAAKTSIANVTRTRLGILNAAQSSEAAEQVEWE